MKGIRITGLKQRHCKHIVDCRAQMEMFGLAVIVVMITLGFLFVITFRAAAPKAEFQKDYTYDELAQNFVNSVISVNVRECGTTRITVSDLIKYCNKGEDVTYRCGGQDACLLLNSTLKTILSRTLESRNDAFMLYTEGLNAPGFRDINLTNPNRNCTSRMERGQRGVMPISMFPQPGNVFIYLDICKPG